MTRGKGVEGEASSVEASSVERRGIQRRGPRRIRGWSHRKPASSVEGTSRVRRGCVEYASRVRRGYVEGCVEDVEARAQMPASSLTDPSTQPESDWPSNAR